MKQIFIVLGLIFLSIQPLMSQLDSTKNRRMSGAERKLIEIKKIVDLSPAQEKSLKAAYTLYQQKSDSILFNVADPAEAAVLKYRADKQLQETLIYTLTEQQRIQYLTITGTPDVMAKTEAKVETLRESGQYSEEELVQKGKEIFDYLMAEKIVYLRDKYNIAKQRDNIRRLRNSQPASLRESDTREKLKVLGRMNKGKVKW